MSVLLSFLVPRRRRFILVRMLPSLCVCFLIVSPGLSLLLLSYVVPPCLLLGFCSFLCMSLRAFVCTALPFFLKQDLMLRRFHHGVGVGVANHRPEAVIIWLPLFVCSVLSIFCCHILYGRQCGFRTAIKILKAKNNNG